MPLVIIAVFTDNGAGYSCYCLLLATSLVISVNLFYPLVIIAIVTNNDTGNSCYSLLLVMSLVIVHVVK